MPKQYTSLSEYYKTTYGEKVYKLAIDGGFTCPNRDGTLDTRGCIFCSEGGSGDFASSREYNIVAQIQDAKKCLTSKTNAQKFIVYFQAFTNTYDTADRLEKLYMSALIDDSIVGISIATRADCLGQKVLDVLERLNQLTDVYVEIGLQTIHDVSAQFIRRGYNLSVYDEAVDALVQRQIRVVSHLILGLPGETVANIKASVDYVCSKPIHGIKLQLLHVLKGTDLATLYAQNPFHIFELDEYVELIVDLLHQIPKTIVIHRLTGDGPKELLIAPKWSRHKRQVLNAITKELNKELL